MHQMYMYLTTSLFDTKQLTKSADNNVIKKSQILIKYFNIYKNLMMAKKTYLDRIQCLPWHKISFTFIAKTKINTRRLLSFLIGFYHYRNTILSYHYLVFFLPAITWLIDWLVLNASYYMSSSSSCYFKQTMDKSVKEILWYHTIQW